MESFSGPASAPSDPWTPAPSGLMTSTFPASPALTTGPTPPSVAASVSTPGSTVSAASDRQEGTLSIPEDRPRELSPQVAWYQEDALCTLQPLELSRPPPWPPECSLLPVRPPDFSASHTWPPDIPASPTRPPDIPASPTQPPDVLASHSWPPDISAPHARPPDVSPTLDHTLNKLHSQVLIRLLCLAPVHSPAQALDHQLVAPVLGDLLHDVGLPPDHGGQPLPLPDDGRGKGKVTSFSVPECFPLCKTGNHDRALVPTLAAIRLWRHLYNPTGAALSAGVHPVSHARGLIYVNIPAKNGA